jgi:sulfatase modifying factor 1
MMGDQFGGGSPDEQPVHEVCLSEFSISKYEITQEQWQVVMGNNPAENQENLHYPIDVVSWYEAERFIKKLNEMAGGRYRLPTEAEWEFACRSGGKKVKYGTADDTSDRRHVINSDTEEDERSIRPVGSFPPNELGLYDMSGNVSEWVQDWYELEYYKRSPVNDPQVQTTRMMNRKVRRGGHWDDNSWIQRCTFRNWRKPNYRLIGLGFRLVRDH